MAALSTVATVLAAAAFAPLPVADAAPDPSLYAFGTSSLLQSQDFNDVGVQLDEEQVQLFGGQALSACTGKQSLYAFAGPDANDVGARWTSQLNPDQLLTETVARTTSPAQTATVVHRLTTRVERCQHEPKGHWRYGRSRTLKSGSGSATWMLSYDSHGLVSGGVAIIRDGTTAGILELTSPSGPAKRTVEQLVTAATGRLQ